MTQEEKMICPYWVAKTIDTYLNCNYVQIEKSKKYKSSSMYILAEYEVSHGCNKEIRVRVSDHPHPTTFKGDLDLCNDELKDKRTLLIHLLVISGEKFVTKIRGGGNRQIEQ